MNEEEKRKKFFQAMSLVENSCLKQIDDICLEAEKKIDVFLENKKKESKNNQNA